MGGPVLFQQGGAAEHLVAHGALMEILWVELLEMLLVFFQRGEAEAALLTIMRFCHVCSQETVT